LLPSSVAVVCYRVHKINRWHRIQPRLLRLTLAGVENIKKGVVVTKFHPYQYVTRVLRQDTTNFVVQYDNDHDYHYISPVAMEIVQEIEQRVALARARMNNPSASRGPATPRGPSSFAEELQTSLGVSSWQSTSLLQTSSPSTDCSPASGSGAPATLSPPSDVDLDALLAGHVQAGTLTSLRSRRRRGKLAHLTGSSESDRLSRLVDELVLDTSTDEGNTVSSFVLSFPPPDVGDDFLALASCVTNFLCGMRSHLLAQEPLIEKLRRIQVISELVVDESADEAVSLQRVIFDSLTRAILPPLYPSVVLGPLAVAPLAPACIAALGTFDSQVGTTGPLTLSSLTISRRPSSLEDSDEFSAPETPPDLAPDGSCELSLTRVPLELLSPIVLPGDTEEREDTRLWRLSWVLSQQPQVFYDVKPRLRLSDSNSTPNAYRIVCAAVLSRSVVADLAGRRPLPQEIASALADFVRAIHRVAPTDAALGAEDLIPLFVYCSVAAHIPHMAAVRGILTELSDPDAAAGSSGYHATCWHAACSFIERHGHLLAARELSRRQGADPDPLSLRHFSISSPESDPSSSEQSQ
jgi:hypothetical protein